MITASMKSPLVKVEVNSYGSLSLDVTIGMVSTDQWQHVVKMLLLNVDAGGQALIEETIEEALNSDKGVSYYYDETERLVTISFVEGSPNG